MMRLPRIVSSLALAVCLGAACPMIGLAQDAPATPAAEPTTAAAEPTAAAPATALSDEQKNLLDLTRSYWHFAKMGQYALAADAGDKILAASDDPRAILQAFEAAAAERGDVLMDWILRWRSIPPRNDDQKDVVLKMKDVSAKLGDKISQGFDARRSDPQFIRDTIIAMSKGARAYENNRPRLLISGELAVKVMIDMLRNPDDRQYNGTVRRALRDLGRKALSPLLASTEMKDPVVLVDVLAALGDIKYDTPIPYLARLANDKAQPDPVRSAASAALSSIGAGKFYQMNPAAQFLDLAEKFYYGNASVTPSGDKTSCIWYWDDVHGLTKADVPSSIFNDVMAMRCCEYALKLNPSMGSAVSLWLASDSKREVDLPAGAEDPSHRGSPDAHYYNVSAGVTYLNAALARALKDVNAPLALKLSQALHDIIGTANILNDGGPITDALTFPNRQVRYEAAFVLAESLPDRQFTGYQLVVPLLAEALSQSNKPNVLVVAPTPTVGDLLTAVNSLGYPVASATTTTDGVAAAASLSAVDIIIIDQDSDVQKMREQALETAKLQGASILVLTKVANNPYAVAAATDPLLNSAVMPAKAALADTLRIEIDKARVHAGAAPLTDAQATAYAMRAADLLARLAINRNKVLDPAVAQTPIIAALADSRPEIAKAVGNALGMIKSRPAQNGLALRALTESVPPDVRVSLFRSLATNAKYYGNALDEPNITALEKVVTDNKNADVRDAAAQARGALNLPSDQARTLIVGQSKM